MGVQVKHEVWDLSVEDAEAIAVRQTYFCIKLWIPSGPGGE